MGDHHPQRDGRRTGQLRAHGGMAVQIDIARKRYRQFGPDRLLQGFALLEALGFLGRDIAFMEGHVAAMADRDINATALALGAMDMLPEMESLASGQHGNF